MRKIRLPRARSSDPATSWEAARSVTNLRMSQRVVLDTLRRHGPMTDEEIYEKLPVQMSLSGARTRRRELVDKGHVRDSGKRSTTKSGRKTIVWEVL